MTWIKICGITNLEDALVAVDAGADALGFVFYEKSPRRADVETAREIVAKLPEKVEKVGVFVGGVDRSVIEIFNHARLTVIQMHFSMSTVAAQQKAPGRNLFWRMPEFYWVFSARTIVDREELMRDSVRSFEHWRRESAPDLEVPGGDGNQPSNGKYPSQPVIFFDAGTHDRPGGTGTTFDWKAAAPLVESLRGRAHFVVAGGLNPSNVATAIRVLDPFGVDVASGVEARPGKKDPEKVRAFVQAVRAADRKVG